LRIADRELARPSEKVHSANRYRTSAAAIPSVVSHK
jgi:hypothetical protein